MLPDLATKQSSNSIFIILKFLGSESLRPFRTIDLDRHCTFVAQMSFMTNGSNHFGWQRVCRHRHSMKLPTLYAAISGCDQMLFSCVKGVWESIHSFPTCRWWETCSPIIIQFIEQDFSAVISHCTGVAAQSIQVPSRAVGQDVIAPNLFIPKRLGAAVCDH